MNLGAIAIVATLAATSGLAAETGVAEQAKALLADPPPADMVWRLRQDLGAERFKALNDQVFRQMFQLPETYDGGRVTLPCMADRAKARLLALTQMAMATDDEATWKSRLKEADGALAKWAQLRRADEARTEDKLKTLGPSAPAWRVELARRVDQDQFVRSTAPAFAPPGGWSDGVSAPVRQYLMSLGLAEMCAVDRDDTDWLKGEIARRGWPVISRDGKDADQQAWLLVQHADHDPAWQAQVLVLLAELAPKGETDPKNYAYLFDRVAMKNGGPQRYGTQGRCVRTGEWRPDEDEPGDLDARRKSVGLPSEAEYVRLADTLCAGAGGG